MHIFPVLITTAFLKVYVRSGLGSMPTQCFRRFRRSLEYNLKHTLGYILDHNRNPPWFKRYLCTNLCTGYPRFFLKLLHEMKFGPIEAMRTVRREPLAPGRLFLAICVCVFIDRGRFFIFKPQQTIHCRASAFLPQMNDPPCLGQFLAAACQLRSAYA